VSLKHMIKIIIWIRDMGCYNSYIWKSSIGTLRRRLQTVIVYNTPKTMYSRNAVVGYG
jgi:hypothetical protein